MSSIRNKNTGIYAMVIFHFTICFSVILVLRLLNGFVGSNRYIWEYMKISGGVSIALLIAVTTLLIHYKRFWETSGKSTISKGLGISTGLWIVIIALSLMHGFLNNPILEMNIFYWPLYPIAYFDEWMAQLFDIDMGKNLTTETVAIFSTFTVVYQLCYAMIPVGIILCVRRFSSSKSGLPRG